MTDLQRCSNCGAVTKEGGPDVRKRVCEHCGSELMVAIDSDQIAAGMALDLANADAFLNQLAKAFTHGFADRARVERVEGRILKVELDLGKEMYVALLEVDRVTAQVKKMVRGVALKTATHPLEAWVGLLSKAIAAHVNTNAKAAAVLAQLRIS